MSGLATEEWAWASNPQSLDTEVLRAVAEIKKFDGVNVSVMAKAKSLVKYGHAETIDSTGYKTVWEGSEIADEEPLFGDPSLGNVLDSISSADTLDTETVRIEGHTKSGDDLTFVVQVAVLDGFNEVTLTIPLHTCTRVINQSATEIGGPVYIYDTSAAGGNGANGVPVTTAAIGGYLKGNDDTHGQQSGQAFSAVSSSDYFIVTQLIADVNRSGNGNYDIEWQTRSTTGVWRPMEMDLALDTGATSVFSVDLKPCLIIPANTYFRAIAISSSATDGEVSVEIGGYLAAIHS